ncbi:hypothetical protein TsocGM_07305 [Tautonia sociabilis]|uniref:Uncharacterized protein n=2 Tax=Tautonia sociabilis TaxID=2080755 RepID=A0A432MM74_9BACT|nr:hypothetical protein TsocGM_07305 [Tautonia sociabilis]
MLPWLLQAGPAQAETPPIRLTVEVNWRAAPGVILGPRAPAPGGVVLEVTEGRVVQALAWPEDDDPTGVPSLPSPEPLPGGAWRIGSEPVGKARARIEAPIQASMTVRLGSSRWTIPLLSLLDGPQATPVDGGTMIEVRRLPWDAIEVHVPGDGTATPGAVVPVTVGVNVLAPEPTQVDLSLSVRLRPIRGDRVLWEDSRRVVVPTNAGQPPGLILPVQMPDEEGTYVLELATTWAPRGPQADSSRLGRWWRRLRPQQPPDGSVRRVSLTVLSRSGPSPPGSAPESGAEPAEVVVDAVGLGRARGIRPRPEGRAPADLPDPESPWAVPIELLVDPPRRDRHWTLLSRVGTDSRPLREAGPEGLSWTAAPLKVAHPNRPHRLDLEILDGEPSALSVALIAPGVRPRLLLDARGSGGRVEGAGPPRVLSWPIWPDASEPVLVVVNRSPDRPLALGDASLVELAGEPAPLKVSDPPPDGGRAVALRLTGPGDLDRFGGLSDDGPDDPLSRASHLASYLDWLGASAVVVPDSPADRPIRSALEGQADEDPIGPDRDGVLRSILDRQGVELILEVDLEGVSLPGLPPPGSYEAEARGLVRLDGTGRAEAGTPSYNLLRPEVQRALTRHLLAALEDEGAPASSRPDGLLVRLGTGPTLPGRADTGFDDETYRRFVAEAIKGASAPGLDPTDPARFASRLEYLTGPASVPWLSWRSRQVGEYYSGLASRIAEARPGVRLLVATPGLDDGPAGAEARRVDREGLSPEAAWRSLGLDLDDWPRGDGPAPIVLRGVGARPVGLEHDLASHPALDAPLLDHSTRGVLLGIEDAAPRSSPLKLSARGVGPDPGADEPFGHALAALDASWVVVSSPTASGAEQAVRRFSRAFRALPSSPGVPAGASTSGVLAREISAGEDTYIAIANDTPFAVEFSALLAAPASAPIVDLAGGTPLRVEAASGGRRVSVDLGPFGVAAFRVGAPGAHLGAVSTTFDPAREEHRKEIARRLQELASGGSIARLNPGFEPEAALRRAASDGEDSWTAAGWTAEGAGGPSVAIVSDRPRTGRGSLLLIAPEAPAAASSPSFAAPGPAATLRAFLRTEPPDASVRIRIDSEPGASEPVRLAADLPRADRRNWSPLALRAPGLPTGSSSSLRLRFELRSPGKLWVDDLSLVGQGLAQARSCLTAALQAYDEGRYADFARLSRSHWVEASGGPILPGGATSPSPGSAPAGAIATDLPERARLR